VGCVASESRASKAYWTSKTTPDTSGNERMS
jgi:hypothetical protein